MNDRLIFDIGMHLGEDTAFYIAKGFRVAGFEANAQHVDHCRRRFESEIELGQLIVFNGALRAADAPAITEFFVNVDHSDWGTADPGWRTRNAVAFGSPSEATAVPTVYLEQVFGQLGLPIYAKIDIEGLDHEILGQFARSRVVPRFLSIESAKTSWADLENEISVLSGMGYRRFKAVQQRTIPKSTIRTRDTSGKPLSYTFERHCSGPFGDDLTDWVDEPQIRLIYRNIFRNYAMWGDTSWLQRAVGRRPIAAIQMLAGRPLPGWYDTHARLD